MICDKVIYKGEEILTVYHKGHDENIKERIIKKQTKIGRYNLIFIEKYVDDIELENIKDHSYTEEGLLPPDTKMNPYSGPVCANMIHYIYRNKPSCLFTFNDNHYSIKVPVADFLKISKFVKKYTGLDIELTPMILGDTLIYNSTEQTFKTNKDNELILEELPANSTVIIHFKNDDTIVSSKVLNFNKDTEKLVISSDRPWKSHDIEIFNNGELIYYHNDIVYIRRINLSFVMKNEGKTVRLSKIGKTYSAKKETQFSTSCIGEPANEIEEIISKSNNNIRNFLKAENPDDQVFFIKPNELDKVIDLITDICEKAIEEIWIFDPYFTDVDGLSKVFDWLKILINSNSSKRHIVFYSNNNTLSAKDFVFKIIIDQGLNEFIRIKKSLGITCHQVKSPIHDRFILVKNNTEYMGLSIGTSFNSLERNHYCIHKLSHSATKTILNDLINWMNLGNVLSETEV